MEVHAETADDLYSNLWWRIHTDGYKETSRNGPVISIRQPVLATLWDPRLRVLFNPIRRCNPFFHVAEVVWMLAGSDDVRFVEKFNKRYREYADPGTNTVWGAYGERWQMSGDQIEIAIQKLIANPYDRQVVIQMWDSFLDLIEETPHNDRPCNTQIMFRCIDDRLNMLVTNRSNDLVWGMMGANVVHFTYLQELIALSAGLELGHYRVVTNNLHVYPNMPNYESIKESGLRPPETPYLPCNYPILDADSEMWEDLKEDCIKMVNTFSDDRGGYRTKWMKYVALPMIHAYLSGPSSTRNEWILAVEDDAWRTNAKEWAGIQNSDTD